MQIKPRFYIILAFLVGLILSVFFKEQIMSIFSGSDKKTNKPVMEFGYEPQSDSSKTVILEPKTEIIEPIISTPPATKIENKVEPEQKQAIVEKIEKNTKKVVEKKKTPTKEKTKIVKKEIEKPVKREPVIHSPVPVKVIEIDDDEKPAIYGGSN